MSILFCLAERVYHVDHSHLESMMYLMLSPSGHTTIFLTRTRGPFWSIRPAPILALLAVKRAGALPRAASPHGTRR
ncbi:MAG: hypothetical protein ABI633_13890 [Burkholderiales bacterium]